MTAVSAQLPDVLGPLNEVEQHNAPDRVFLEGDASLLSAGRRVAVIGSRDASAEGLARASKIARILAEEHITVVSGLAAGVDTAAHRAAIAAGGRTIAVLGTGLDRAYPAENRDLQSVIGRDHLLISQFTAGSAVAKSNFPRRNRLMALISDATVIVEAGEGSGTLHQGWEALRLGRPLFIMRSVFENPSLKWPAEMGRYGAEVLSKADELLEAISASRELVGDAAPA